MVAQRESQLSDGNLQSTEQFLLGGQVTVRGYDELVASGDQGVLMRNEIYAPSFSAGRLVGCKKAQDQFQFLAFRDIGLRDKSRAHVGVTLSY